MSKGNGLEAEETENEALGKSTANPAPRSIQIPITAHPKPPQTMGTIPSKGFMMSFALQCEQ
jgi:hypothetical protein